ncbi:MAG: hypothetical protein O2934_05825 [Bacteroidetes bacterium]|nr:hypothetical protein [Bacteroidota bacterium]
MVSCAIKIQAMTYRLRPVKYLILGLLTILACNKEDDGFTFVPARDRAEEAPVSTEIIETYLNTHFYNYEEFQNPPADFDFKIRFDTIAGDNADKIPLIQQVQHKMVPDRVDEGVEYKLYYLSALEGGGSTPAFPDVVTLTYEGQYLNTEFTASAYTKLFDSATTPVSFDLTSVVNGFQDGITTAKTSPFPAIEAADGSVSFEDYGVGAVFIPAGLGYYVSPPNGSIIPFYAQLIFTFQLYAARVGDQDEDGIPTIFEDLNENNLEEDDDTDSDGLPNFFDADDDGDGRPTSEEIIVRTYVFLDGEPEPTWPNTEVEVKREYNAQTMETTIYTVEYPDEDNDGIVDYLDSDS